MTPDQTKRAKAVIALLVEAEPRTGRIDSIQAWTLGVSRRIKAQRWAEVCAAIEANPDLSAATIAQRLAPPAASSPVGGDVQTQVTGDLPLVDASTFHHPPADRATTRQRVAAIKVQLATVTKPPMGEPAPSVRGAVPR